MIEEKNTTKALVKMGMKQDETMSLYADCRGGRKTRVHTHTQASHKRYREKKRERERERKNTHTQRENHIQIEPNKWERIYEKLKYFQCKHNGDIIRGICGCNIVMRCVD